MRRRFQVVSAVTDFFDVIDIVVYFVRIVDRVGMPVGTFEQVKDFTIIVVFIIEFMAAQLDITQASYARIESENIKLTVDRLQKIAEILETDISTFFDASKLTIQNQTNNEGAFGNGYVENLHIENRETTKKIIQTLEDEINHLKAEIEFLRAMVKNERITPL
jgi:transcriptional regulator with XRE-family HTH domain